MSSSIWNASKAASKAADVEVDTFATSACILLIQLAVCKVRAAKSRVSSAWRSTRATNASTKRAADAEETGQMTLSAEGEVCLFGWVGVPK